MLASADSAFYGALLRGALIAQLALVAGALSAVVWRTSRSAAGVPPAPRPTGGEAAGRRLLRIVFGLLWMLDAGLQAQRAMPLHMVPGVIDPAADGSPAWVRHLVNAGTALWTDHPVSAAAAAVWVQFGIGVWLLVAPRGTWSRLGGLVSALWGLTIWVFGEAFGGIFGPGLSWLTGAPGAVAFYVAAGLLLALAERGWASPRLGTVILRTIGFFFLGLAVLQAWPDRGFWQGAAGSLVATVRAMARTPQPHWLASWVSAFGDLAAAHGWAVNLFVVVVLAAVGAALVTTHPPVLRVAVVVAVVVCLADWVLVQDLGFLGGMGTDPNSMIPMAALVVAGYLARTRPASGQPPVGALGRPAAASWSDRLGAAGPLYTFRAALTLAAVAILLVGLLPIAAAVVGGARPS